MTLASDYEVIRERAAIGAVADRRQIALAGSERAPFLQGMLTNDIQALAPGSGCYAAWLTPQGRMLTDMHVLESGSMILLDVPAELAEATLQRLDQYLFSEDVRLESLEHSLRGVWVHGPQAAAVVEQTLGQAIGLAEWPDYRHAPAAFDGAAVVVARIDQLGVPGFCLYVEPARLAPLVTALESAGATTVGREAIEAARIEAGYPIYGIDMTDDTIPLEAGIEHRAISLTKGCYVGQEIIIRVLHRGGGRVARRLVALRPDGAVPEPASKIYAGERAIGTVTSAAESPRAGVVALGYVHRNFAAPGTRVELDMGTERVHATVTERPIPTAA